MQCPWCDGTGWRLLSHGGPVRCAHECHNQADQKVPAKINLSQQTRGVTSQDHAVFAHLSSVTPDVKSNKTRILSFNYARQHSGFGKSADPTCYNVSINSQETPMQRFIASYEDAAKAEALAKRNGWDGCDGGFLDYIDGQHPQACRAFPSKVMAEEWLKAEIKADKSLFGCGDIDVMEPVKRRCKYCVCNGWRTVQSFLADDTGITTEERELRDDCHNGDD